MLPAPRSVACCAALFWALAACVADPPPSPPPAPSVIALAAASSRAGDAPTAPRLPACKLPAPLKSDDACGTDADCGVSQPCHAAACVARARSHPSTPETMCTEILECHSADANRCGCFEGRCALIPPS